MPSRFSVNPTIALVNVTNVGQEYSYDIPANTVRFNVKGDSQLRIAIASGGDFITIETAGGGWTENIKDRAAAFTIFLTSLIPNNIVRIISWQN